MTEPLVPMSADAEPADAGRRKQFLVLAGVGGVALVGVAGFLLLSGGGSGSDSVAIAPLAHHHGAAAAAPAPAPTPAAPTPGTEAELQTYNGALGDRDPFAVPAAIVNATAQKSAAPAASAAVPSAAAAAATPLPGSIAIPTTGTTINVAPGGSVTVNPIPDQYIQLLAAHQVGSSWTVDVRSKTQTQKNVAAGSKNIAGTLFYFQGEDETSGTRTFVFTVGEAQGGNLVPNAKESAKKFAADKSTLVLHDGVVDGGLYAE